MAVKVNNVYIKTDISGDHHLHIYVSYRHEFFTHSFSLCFDPCFYNDNKWAYISEINFQNVLQFCLYDYVRDKTRLEKELECIEFVYSDDLITMKYKNVTLNAKVREFQIDYELCIIEKNIVPLYKN